MSNYQWVLIIVGVVAVIGIVWYLRGKRAK